MRRIVFFVPSDRPVGGIAKVLDYAVHASLGGYETIFCCNDFYNQFNENPLFLKPYFINSGKKIRIISLKNLIPMEDDIVFFTLPSNYELLSRKYFRKLNPAESFIHLLQNTRVGEIQFEGGYSYRLLSKKLRRICITDEVFENVKKCVTHKRLLEIIPHGFDFDVFDKAPKKNDKKVLLVNLFKGDFGLKIVKYFQNDNRISNINICRKGISWRELIINYKRSSIFISTPLPEEGLYLPGLEAMAAGNLVITPDCYGNRFYCDFKDNSIKVNYNNFDEYIEAIEFSINNWENICYLKRQNGYQKASNLKLDKERESFNNLLQKWY